MLSKGKSGFLLRCLTAAVLIAVVVLTTACSAPVEEENKEITYYKNTSDLAEDTYYVEAKEGYAEPFWGNTNFEQYNAVSSPDNTRVAWYDDDSWKMIPTVYRGGSVIFRTNTLFDEEFHFEKFFDLGYTFGLANLQQRDSGRWMFSVKDSDLCLNPDSDAWKLTEYGDDTDFVLDAINGKPLREDKVSECGSVKGLSKNEEYPCQIYVGTEIQDITLKADSHTLFSAQVSTVSDYEYLEAEVIKIPIPDSFVSGYYSINGFGLFRYVDGTSYDDSTSFNEMNPTDEQADEYTSSSFYQVSTTDEIEVLYDGEYEIKFVYDDKINTSLLPDGDEKETPVPSVYITPNSDNHVYLEEDTDNKNTLKVTTQLRAGSYPVQIKYIYGRGYTLDTVPVEK